MGYSYVSSLKGSFQHEYTGDRVKEDLINYAMRMSQPAVQRISRGNSIEYLKESHPVFFGFIGKQEGLLWVIIISNLHNYIP